VGLEIKLLQVLNIVYLWSLFLLPELDFHFLSLKLLSQAYHILRWFLQELFLVLKFLLKVSDMSSKIQKGMIQGQSEKDQKIPLQDQTLHLMSFQK
jgi:hypothetical protein